MTNTKDAGATTWSVLKFGGTSVMDRSCWDRIAQIIQQRLDKGIQPFIVLSAPRGVSDALQHIAHADVVRDEDVLDLKSIYMDLAESLGITERIHWDELSTILDEALASLQIEAVVEKARAEVMACGELLLSRLAHVYLEQMGFDSLYLDARNFLKTRPEDTKSDSHYLKSYCPSDIDLSFQQFLRLNGKRVVVTQGFIASNEQGHTVLLGRGGSDTSAAYFAAKLSASACEIWTDVAGIYTANPKVIPEARLLPTLDYDEAQEIALMGGKVLHPESLEPVMRHRIPMHVRSSYALDINGTVISNDSGFTDTSIKSIISKKGVVLIQMTGIAMWKQAGFLATVFDIFKRHEVSVDLISTAEMNVTVTLDDRQQHCSPEKMKQLMDDLSLVCDANMVTSCASISLVGKRMRSMLYKLSSALKIISEHQVYLISQASNDLNFSFVVDERLSDRLVQKLHHLLLENTEADEYVNEKDRFVRQDMLYEADDWWIVKRDRLLELMQQDSSARYVYDLDTCGRQIDRVCSVDAVSQSYYAVKANHNPDLLQLMYDKGLGFECVSIEEVQFVLQLFPAIEKNRVIFTPNFVTGDEFQAAFELGVRVILDAMQPAYLWPDTFKGQQVLLRLDPGVGTGHHRFVSTGGLESKFGMTVEQVIELAGHLKGIDCQVIGLHAHTGSGVLDRHHWGAILKYLLEIKRQHFPDVSILDCGGGLGVAHRRTDVDLNLEFINQQLHELVGDEEVTLWWEPGRFLVAEAGVLLAQVTQIKEKQGRVFIGLNTGMNSLIRPALYGAYHHIINISKLHEPCVQRAHFVGPICESSDCFGYERLVPTTSVGDIILISHAGAYGRSMSSRYNMRLPASELSINH